MLVKVSMIEDDPDLCESWRELLSFMGYELHCHQRAHEALSDVDAVKRCNVVVTDYYLPDINGAELIKRLRALNPQLPAIVLTGSKGAAVQGSVERLRNCKLLHKPVPIDVLTREIAALVATTPVGLS